MASTTPVSERFDSSSNPKRRRSRRKSRDKERSAAGASRSAGDALRLPFHDWQAWSSHVRERVAPRPLCCASAKPRAGHDYLLQLAWGLPRDDSWSVLEDLVDAAQAMTSWKKWTRAADAWQDRVVGWLARAASSKTTPAVGLEALAWAALSPYLTAVLPQSRWLELLECLEDIGRGLSSLSAVTEPWCYHLSAELSIVLAYLYPEVATWSGEFGTARDAMSHGVCEWTDGEGLPRGNALHLMRPLIACWTRAVTVARRMKQPALHAEAQQQFAFVLQQALRLTRRDGSQVFGARRDGPWNRSFLRAALRAADDRTVEAVARKTLPDSVSKSARRSAPLPRPSNVSEWSQCATLRSSWSRRSPQFSVRYDEQGIETAFHIGRHRLWAGRWEPRIEVDGRSIGAEQTAEVVCVFHDKDVEYLELQWLLADGWKLQRQCLLAIRDDFLLLADAIVGPDIATINHRLQLPLESDASLLSADESHEAWLAVGGRRRALLLPLALPEWRSAPSDGSLSCATGNGHPSLVLQQQRRGRGMFCPLFIDFSPRRRKQPYTWRSLTVAQDRQRVPPDMAVGYRVRVGGKQWMIYRSLVNQGGRSVLGQHLLYEFLVGRFQTDGTVDPILQVEAAHD